MYSRVLVSTSFLFSLTLFSLNGSAEAATTQTVAPECKNYVSKLSQLGGKVTRYQATCKAYQTKVTTAETLVDAVEKALKATDLTKKEISKLNIKLKSNKRTLATQKKYATSYCDKVNTYQEDYSAYQTKCKPKDEAPTGDTSEVVIKETSCDSSARSKICYKRVLKNRNCFDLFENTYYSKDEFDSSYRLLSQQKSFTITFPSPGASSQVGLVYLITGTSSISVAECKISEPK